MPVLVSRLLCSAEALKLMGVFNGDSMDAVALYGAGVLVGAPSPARNAVHKLLIALERQAAVAERS